MLTGKTKFFEISHASPRSMQTRITRLLLVIAAVLLAACTNAAADTLDTTKFTPLDDFPAGVGRGFPLAQLTGAAGAAEPVRFGDIAPDFALVLADGRHTTLRALYGQPVVLNFWATWCGPCRIEMPELMSAAANDPGLVMLAVNVQEAAATVQPFADKFAMHTPVVLDTEGAVQDLYGVRGLPTTFFIDKEGRVAAVYPGALSAAALSERLAAIR